MIEFLDGNRISLPGCTSLQAGDQQTGGLNRSLPYDDFAEQCLEMGESEYKTRTWKNVPVEQRVAADDERKQDLE